MSKLSFFSRCALVCATVLSGLSVQAQPPAQAQEAFPSKPVTLIVNFPPGGVTDGTFRRLAERFKTVTGESLIILNKPGRGVAAATLAMAKPDGYTLGIIGRTQMSLYETLKGKQPYHPVNDFVWIANVTSSYFGLYVPAQSPYRTVQDLVKAAKAKPGALRYGTAFGHGGLSHVPMEEFSQAAGIEMVHVPFKGDSDAVMTVVQGEIEAIVAGGTAMPFVDEGRLRLLAWLAPQRNPRLPNVPTMRELGYPIEVVAPVGVGGPKGMDPAHVAFFEKTFRSLLEAPEIRSYLEQNYQRVDFMDSKSFTAWAQRQLPLEKEIVQRFNLATDAKP